MLGIILAFLLGVGLTVAATTFYHPILTPKLQDLQKKYEFWKKQADKYMKIVDRLSTQYYELNKKYNDLKSKYDAAISTIKDYKQKYENALTEVAKWKNLYKDTKAEADKYKKLYEEYYQKYQELQSSVSSYEETIKKYEDQIAAYQSAIQSLQQQLSETEAEKDEWKQKYNDLLAQYQDLQAKYDKLKKYYLNLRRDIAYLLDINMNSLQAMVDVKSETVRKDYLSYIFDGYKTFNPQTYYYDIRNITDAIHTWIHYVPDPTYPPTSVHIIVKNATGQTLYDKVVGGIVDPKVYEYLLSDNELLEIRVQAWGKIYYPNLSYEYAPYAGDLAKHPVDTWVSHAGDCEDMAILVEELVNGYCVNESNCWAGVLTMYFYGTNMEGPGHAVTFINITYFGTPKYIICDPVTNYCTKEYTDLYQALYDYAINAGCSLAYNIPQPHIVFHFLVKERKNVLYRMYANPPMVKLPDYESPVPINIDIACP